MGISEKLKSLLEDKNISVNAFAIQIDVPPSTIHSIIDRGSTRIDVDTIIKIAHGLDITADELLDAPPRDGKNCCDLIYQCYGKSAYELVKVFLSLNDAGKEAALLQIKALAQSNNFLKNPQKENLAS